MYTEAPEIVFQRSKGGRLKISSEALSQMETYRQVSTDTKEAGGVLLGRYIKDSTDVVIDCISTPQRNDKRTRFSFFKNKKEHQNIVNKAWAESNGTSNYLGEWHTHPEPSPTPSSVDKQTWLRQVVESTFENDSLFFIIVGTTDIAAFEVFKSSKKINKLSQWPTNEKESQII
ncbi:MAG: Mov34/MPN/PAD-1 family protein [Saprospiraceae bacterium]